MRPVETDNVTAYFVDERRPRACRITGPHFFVSKAPEQRIHFIKPEIRRLRQESRYHLSFRLTVNVT